MSTASNGMVSTATFSQDGKHRLALFRTWNDDPASKVALVCMVNPSTADADKNDPTISTLITYFKARAEYGALAVVNWCSYISTDPKGFHAWWAAQSREALDIVVRRNLAHITRLSEVAGIIVAAWGNLLPEGSDTKLTTRSVLEVLTRHGQRSLYTFGLTNSGNPKHPLARGAHRVRVTDPLIEWK